MVAEGEIYLDKSRSVWLILEIQNLASNPFDTCELSSYLKKFSKFAL